MNKYKVELQRNEKIIVFVNAKDEDEVKKIINKFDEKIGLNELFDYEDCIDEYSYNIERVYIQTLEDIEKDMTRFKERCKKTCPECHREL